jgi:hypothetical protein
MRSELKLHSSIGQSFGIMFQGRVVLRLRYGLVLGVRTA